MIIEEYAKHKKNLDESRHRRAVQKAIRAEARDKRAEAAAAAAARFGGSYRQLPPSSVRSRLSRQSARHDPRQSTNSSASGRRSAQRKRSPPYLGHVTVDSLDFFHPSRIDIQAPPVCVPQRVRIRDYREQILKRGPTMVSVLSPSPRAAGVSRQEMKIPSPQPMPRSPMSQNLYTRKQLFNFRVLSEERRLAGEGPRRIPTTPYLARHRRITDRDIRPGKEEIRVSRHALWICAATFILLPFYACEKLDWVMKWYTGGRIDYPTKASRREAWLWFIGEIILIICCVITGVAVFEARKVRKTS